MVNDNLVILEPCLELIINVSVVSVARGTPFAPTLYTFDDLVLVEFISWHPADAPCSKLRVVLLNALQTTQSLKALLLPLRYEGSIRPLLSQAIVV